MGFNNIVDQIQLKQGGMFGLYVMGFLSYAIPIAVFVCLVLACILLVKKIIGHRETAK